MTYQETRTAVEGPAHAAERAAKSVLIVEDNELNMKLFHDLLDAHGYRTIQTRNGLDAISLARAHRPDLILMDIQLPEVSGLERSEERRVGKEWGARGWREHSKKKT